MPSILRLFCLHSRTALDTGEAGRSRSAVSGTGTYVSLLTYSLYDLWRVCQFVIDPFSNNNLLNQGNRTKRGYRKRRDCRDGMEDMTLFDWCSAAALTAKYRQISAANYIPPFLPELHVYDIFHRLSTNPSSIHSFLKRHRILGVRH
jgi:hypothetical protein